MEIVFEKYLDKINRYLKPIPVSERIDIIKEIKGSILEMENENLSANQILERLGEPKELAKAYLCDLISEKKESVSSFSLNRFLVVCAFYGLTGFSGMFIIPILGIVAPVFILCGVISPFAGFFKFVCSLFGYDIPYVIFQLGSITLSPALGFLYSIIIGVILIFLGKKAWKLLLKYIKTVSRTKKNLYI